MSGVQQVEVKDDDDGIRVDRWFKRHYPQVNHGALEKLLRTGQVRVDGGRVKSNVRLEAGQIIRVPPIDDTPKPKPRTIVSDEDARFLRELVIFENKDLIAINKPPGLAVQGGSKTTRHVDGMLEALRPKGGEKPKLVHRIDKDTSGILVLAKTAKSAAWLAKSFQGRSVEKIYWALTAGVPHPLQGTINLPLAKRDAGGGGEQMVPGRRGDKDAQRAVTHYAVVENTGTKAAWVALMPVTGRTHQLRAHLLAIGTPIVGDGKYGGEAAFLGGNISKKMHLHARQITLPGGITITAPLTHHMAKSWKFFDFNLKDDGNPFAELKR